MSPTHLFIHLFIHIRSQAAQVETRRENELRPVYLARVLVQHSALVHVFTAIGSHLQGQQMQKVMVPCAAGTAD